MGNCLQRESDMQWGGDDWSSSPLPDDFTRRKVPENTGEGEGEGSLLLGQKKVGGSTSLTTTEVKIKLSKKQLEELLGNVDLKGLSIQQVLARLIAVSDEFEAHDQRSWRPNLQSIPE